MSVEDRCGANNAIWLCQTCAKLIDNDEIRFTLLVLMEWKRLAEAAALSEIGKTRRSRDPMAAVERQIRRNLRIRDKLERLLLRSVEERRARRASRPYERFRTQKIVVRSVDDAHYPKVDNDPPERISGWLVVEPYDFYHGGLEVILSIRRAAIDNDGNWAFVEDDVRVDDSGSA